jgi:hypothetical protein
MKELPEAHDGNLPARYQYIEGPPPNEPPAEPETGGLIEYCRRRRCTRRARRWRC